MRLTATLIANSLLVAAAARAQAPAPQLTWHDISVPFERIEECPARMALPLSPELFRAESPKGEMSQRTTNTASVRCAGATITELEIVRRKDRESGDVALAIRPQIEMRKGRDKLAVLLFELRQGDRLVSEVELVMEVEEGKLNRRLRAAKLVVPPEIVAEPQYVLRIRLEIEEHD